MAANEEGGISGRGDVEQLPPGGILINIPLPTSPTNEGSTNSTDLAATIIHCFRWFPLHFLSDFRNYLLVWECLAIANHMLQVDTGFAS